MALKCQNFAIPGITDPVARLYLDFFAEGSKTFTPFEPPKKALKGRARLKTEKLPGLSQLNSLRDHGSLFQHRPHVAHLAARVLSEDLRGWEVDRFLWHFQGGSK